MTVAGCQWITWTCAAGGEEHVGAAAPGSPGARCGRRLRRCQRTGGEHTGLHPGVLRYYPRAPKASKAPTIRMELGIRSARPGSGTDASGDLKIVALDI